MSLTSTTIATLAGKLCHDLDNSTTIARFYTDVVEGLGKLDNPIFFAGGFVELTASTGVYSFPSMVLRLFDSFYGEYYLSETSEEFLAMYDEDYRSEEGDPMTFTQDLLNNQFRLYPVPDTSSTAGGNDLGSAFEADWVYVIGSHNRTTSVLECHALPIALLMLVREFSYISKHQDVQFAENCQQLADVILALEGIR